MKNPKILCIDFGSAYTKCAYRSDWNEKAQLIRDVPLAPRDAPFCIPSVVARVERNDGVRWSIGEAAAGQRPGEGVTIYRHWKSRLLSPHTEDEEAREVGVVFFKELRLVLGKMPLPVPVDCYPVRLCIPRLRTNDADAQQRMVSILRDAGWSLAENRATVYEPESNACGVFTRGRNYTWRPRHPSSPDRCPYNPNMFDTDGLFGAFRKARGGYVHYGVLVADVGAFTTDFGYVEFDNDYEDDAPQHPPVTQLSCELGVRELDDLVCDRMRPEVRHAIRGMPIATFEGVKRRLYNRQPAAIVNPAGGIFRIGEGEEAAAFADAINGFATRVVQAMNQFCGNHVKRRIDAEVLTGGGAMIPLVRESLVNAMRINEGVRLYDLLDPNEPLEALWLRRDPREVESRLRENRELVRGGSAIGGCSVFFE